MIDFKLANIVLTADERTEKFPALYYFSESPLFNDEARGGTTLMPYAKYDCATYFNAFSYKKWRTYADVDNVRFHIEAKGKAEFVFYSVSETMGLEKTILGRAVVDSDDFTAIDFEYPQSDAEMLAFWIVTKDFLTVRGGYYSTKVEESRIRKIHLAIATTTFNHEDYIAKNVRLFKDAISASDDSVAGNASMIVVDNGRTLNPTDFEGDGVYVFANKNVGGAGGFARGMIEAGRLEHEVTHVLIMDDDIQLSSESIKRTFNLLSLVNDDYAEAFISGAMFSIVNQTNQYEDVARIDANAHYGAVKPRRCMDKLEDVFHNEDDLPTKGNLYAAFWYCCIPMKTIREKGLPLPIFIRFDDAEYGLRCKPKFMTMNGINVWHMDFDDRYNTFYERYCLLRNLLIIQAASGVCKNVDFIEKVFKPKFTLEMQQLNYPAAEMLLDAVDDFLKGPEFIAVDCGEALLKEKMPKGEKFKNLEELDIGSVSLTNLSPKDKRSKRMRRIEDLTYNGQRYTPEKKRRKSLVAIRFRPDTHPGSKIRFCKKLLVVDRLGKKGVIRVADSKRFKELVKRYDEIVKRYDKEHTEVEKKYRRAQPVLVSPEFWKGYLEID